MSRIEIVLSDSAHAFVEEQLAQGCYRDASEYFEALVHEARRKVGSEEIDLQLIESLSGPPGAPLTSEFWDDLEREARRRATGRDVRR